MITAAELKALRRLLAALPEGREKTLALLNMDAAEELAGDRPDLAQRHWSIARWHLLAVRTGNGEEKAPAS